MILCNTGPLVALLVPKDVNHQRCVTALESRPPEPFLVPWPCLVEAMYFLGKAAGYTGQARLWEAERAGKLVLHSHDESELRRIQALMQHYSNFPMDLADASVVTVAELLQITEVFTVDSHFRAYRLANGRFLDVFP